MGPVIAEIVTLRTLVLQSNIALKLIPARKENICAFIEKYIDWAGEKELLWGMIMATIVTIKIEFWNYHNILSRTFFSFCVLDTRIISVSHLEMTWADRSYFPPLLVRILHKSILRYYGKPDKKMIEPYQVWVMIRYYMLLYQS